MGKFGLNFMKAMIFFIRHLPTLFALITITTTLAIFVPYAVEQKGYVAGWWHVVTGAITGFAVGGSAAWIIGGAGIALMGSAYALPVLAILSGCGVVLGAGLGGSVTFLRFINDPTRFEVNYFWLSAIIAASALISAFAWWIGVYLRAVVARCF